MKKTLLIFITLLIFALCLFINQRIKARETKMNIATLKGPTGIGMLKIIDENDNHKKYNIIVYTDPMLIVTDFLNHDIDIATLPTNIAATLYNKTNYSINMLALNSFSNLYILTDLSNIHSISDLKGKTIYTTGQGSIPQYALEYVLYQNGINYDNETNIEYEKEHSQLAALAIMSDIHIVMLPEPFVSEVISKNPNMKIVIDINDEWNKVRNKESLLPMGCIVARKDFIECNKMKVDNFLNEYKSSVSYVNDNIKVASLLADKYDIMKNSIALKAISNCNITFVEGEDMRNKVNMLLRILSSFDSKSIGESIPNEDFYYKR